MASLLLLVSQVLTHQNVDLEFSNSLPSSSCGATMITGAPCFTQRSDTSKKPAMPSAKREEDFEEVLPVLICADLVWP
ncbi:hypothetical protein AgCh_028078 [Apium graveolens]